MATLTRRGFFSGTLGAAASLTCADRLAARDSSEKVEFDTLFLTWQRDPTTSMTVQWVEGDRNPTERAVTYLQHGQQVWQSVVPRKRPYPRTDRLHIYRAELIGLSPGSEYRFQIGAESPVFRFRTMPDKLTDTFSFVSGGDCGINHNAIATNALAAKQDPMFVLIAGDLGYDNGKDAGISLAFLRNYRKAMIDSMGRLIPLLVTLGNHEVRGGYNQPRENGTFFFPLHDGLYSDASYAALDFGDYLSLVLLDTGHVSRIAGEQTDWLAKVLAERAERSHLIAACHVPAYPSHREYDPTNQHGCGCDNRRHWCPLFEKYNVDVVLEHHDHTFKRTFPIKGGLVDQHGVTFLGDGSWGMLRPPIPLEKRPYMAKASMAYHLSLHRLEADRQFHLALSNRGRVEDVCMTRKRPQRAMGRGAPT
jgi:hypothetical protein